MKRTSAAVVVAAIWFLGAEAPVSANHAMFESELYFAAEEDPFVEVMVYLSDTGENPRQGPGEQVNYSTRDIDALAGQDYVATSGTIQFAVGQTSATIRIPLLNDDVDEFDETFSVFASNTLGPQSASRTTVVLADGESPPGEPSPPSDRVTSGAGDSRPDRAPAGAAAGRSELPGLVGGAQSSLHSAGPAGADPRAELEEGPGFELSSGPATAEPGRGSGSDSSPVWVAGGAVATILALGVRTWASRARWSRTRS